MKLTTWIQTAVAALALTGTALYAQPVVVKDAWIRSSVQGQKASGAFMTITAKDGAKLLGGASPVAGAVEVHEMTMEGNVMRMRAMPALDLPAGKLVELKSGGRYHVMLLDLKVALRKDSTVPLTLVFQDGKGVQSKVELQVPVSTVAPGAAMTEHGHGMKH